MTQEKILRAYVERRRFWAYLADDAKGGQWVTRFEGAGGMADTYARCVRVGAPSVTPIIRVEGTLTDCSPRYNRLLRLKKERRRSAFEH
jgi:hypothetical protein